MTDCQIPVDDQDVLKEILENAAVLLLDFDGPICSVFSGIPAHLVAKQLRCALRNGGHTELPSDIEESADPFDVFRYAASFGPEEAQRIEACLTSHEIEAVATAEPTLGAQSTIKKWHAIGRQIAIVSNNSAISVKAYTDRFGLSRYISTISARTSSNPDLLKPNGYLLNRTLDQLGKLPEDCVFIGDSSNDIQAAHACSIRVIAFARNSAKLEILTSFAPTMVITTMNRITNNIVKQNGLM